MKESDEHTSPPPGTFWSLGVQVANSHFSNTIASSGKSGWLQGNKAIISRGVGREAVFARKLRELWSLSICCNLEAPADVID